MALVDVGLDDKYRLDAKRIFLSGTQALVRLPMLQRERDRAQGLNTAGFISGYRGSPLGMYDHALWRAKDFLKQHDIEFAPGLNEDLAATAVWGSQQVGMFPGAKADGAGCRVELPSRCDPECFESAEPVLPEILLGGMAAYTAKCGASGR
jgi:indolepyruvate ferredoxin oxidoreductase